MKLATKIISGFAVLIAIAALLGGIAIWKMSGVKTVATTLAGEYMPAAGLANSVERSALQTMYAMRGYALSEDTNMLAQGQANLTLVLQHLKEAKDLATKTSSQNLTFLSEATDRAQAKVAEYESLVKKTVAVTESLTQDRAAMDTAAAAYVKESTTYLDDQHRILKDLETSTNVETAGELTKVLDRVNKIALAGDIIDQGNAIRIGNFKSQATRNPALFQETLKKFDDLNHKLDELQGITKQAANLKQIELCRAAAQAYQKAMDSFLAHWLEREELGQQRGKVADAVLAEAKNTAGSSMDASAKGSTAAAGSLAQASTTMVIGLIVAGILGIGLALIITRGITRILFKISSDLGDGSNQVVAAAGQVSSASQSLAEGASEQASSLEETSASLEEMSSMTKRNAENARKANELARQAREAADKGVGDMQTMAAAMEAIKLSSDDIAKIIKTIDEIAFQTNILALNAAVEAARAGEAGMGFAVVADEVRNLAQRCAQAAKETAVKIEGAIQKTGQGVEISNQVAAGLNAIVSKVREVDELVTEVANASREQTDGITQINTAVGQMDKVTQGNAANAEESAAAAEELNAQAEQMKGSVSELLALVRGRDAGGTTAPGRPASGGSHSATTTRPPTEVLPVVSQGAKFSNGNGHQAPKRETSTKRRLEIPLEESFKDF